MPLEGGKLHRLFSSSVPNERYIMKVKLATGGRQVAPTFSLIDSLSDGPNEVQVFSTAKSATYVDSRYLANLAFEDGFPDRWSIWNDDGF